MQRKLLAAMLRRIVRTGRLSLVDYDGETEDIGDLAAPPLILKLNDRRVARDLLLNPYLSFGESYMDGRFSIENGDVGDLLALVSRDIGTKFGGGYLEWLAAFRAATRRWRQRNSLGRSQHNVAHHYDLSGRLYDLFLDTDKQYSCAFFESANDSLETAQLNKKRRLAAKLALKPGHRVLDIGSGWGGLGMFLALNEGADVTGVTLSAEQLNVANARASCVDLTGRVRFVLDDYRNLTGTYDRVVSVGMFEHVGIGNYEAYFRRIADLMNDHGVAVVHSIGRSDGPGATNAWIEKYIFPGGYVPALSEVLPAVERAGLILADVEILRLHYAYTLAEWRRRFVSNWERAKSLYDERFCRMWEFYLAGAEMAFRYHGQMVFQLQLLKRIDALPIARDYMMVAGATGARRRAGATQAGE